MFGDHPLNQSQGFWTYRLRFIRDPGLIRNTIHDAREVYETTHTCRVDRSEQSRPGARQMPYSEMFIPPGKDCDSLLVWSSG